MPLEPQKKLRKSGTRMTSRTTAEVRAKTDDYREDWYWIDLVPCIIVCGGLGGWR